ncbi:MAG: hypothetical protein RL514_4831 [Verrucomicrobiota bacterium]
MKTAPENADVLRPLVARLKACPSQDTSFSEKLLLEAWERFKHTGWDRGTEPTPAVIAGLVLHDENTARLLNAAERVQLLALSTVALERYQQKTNPPNQLGKTIAASLKESI